jgi:hypothetical protein
MDHQGTKAPRPPIPAELDQLARLVVDAAFGLLINFNVAFIKDGIKRIAL